MRSSFLRHGLAGFALAASAAQAPAAPPQLVRQGSATQLAVQGKPMMLIAGELGNSSASSAAYMAPHWARLKAMHLNTVLAPVSWELIEPQEGRFDWSSVDALIRDARAHDLKLVILWFGAWKNSMSTYVPGWVKRDQARFPRAARPNRAGRGHSLRLRARDAEGGCPRLRRPDGAHPGDGRQAEHRADDAGGE